MCGHMTSIATFEQLRSPTHTLSIACAAPQEALGIRPGAPPPWLINMQRYGPPPAYPTMKIPGLNAPIPPGASYGYQPGGWGRPPVDERGLPLYGDAFGTAEADSDEGIDKAHWGDMVSEESESGAPVRLLPA